MSEKKQYDLAIYIGKFSPFCNHHLETVKHGLSLSKQLLIVIGSAGVPNSYKHPFNEFQRASMIWATCFEEFGESFVREKVKVHYQEDRASDAQWLSEIIGVAEKFKPKSVVLVGSKSDETSWYIDLFDIPKSLVKPVTHDFCTGTEVVHATMVREQYFHNGEILEQFVPKAVVKELVYTRDVTNNYNKTLYQDMKEEYAYVNAYKASWATAPFPPIFVTVDAVVLAGEQSEDLPDQNKLLLIRRGHNPGKGLWALPGGFLNYDERIVDGAIREARKETGLVLKKDDIIGYRIFDNPSRSIRGRTITNAFLWNLPEIVEVKGADDAVEAKWFTVKEVLKMKRVIFEDHFHIINTMLTNSNNELPA